MSDLLKINVNDHTERKNGLTYLSWAWAWAEVLKIDPQATWEAHEYSGLPCIVMPDSSCMVKVSVTIKGHTKSSLLPVMNHRNQAIKNPDAFAINTAIVRCLTKAVSMHGLGLYIYAGEDLPESEEAPKKAEPIQIKGVTPLAGALESLPEDEQPYIRELAEDVVKAFSNSPKSAQERIEIDSLDSDQKAALWSLLPSHVRSGLKKVAAEQKVSQPA